MLHLTRYALTRTAVTLLAVAALVLAPGAGIAPAAALPATSSAVQAKEAEKAAALAELQQLEIRLNTQITAYTEIARKIEQTRGDLTDANLRVIAADMRLQDIQAALQRRISQLYRGGQVGLVELVLGAGSMQDLMDRIDYLAMISRHDTRLLEETRIARQQYAWEEQTLAKRAGQLASLQEEADMRRLDIEHAIGEQQAKATAIGEDITRLMRLRSAGSTPSGEFNPDMVISDANFRDVASMTVKDIQAFLEDQPGTLKSYRARDHNGTVRSTAEMIAEAAAGWKISPKVILVTLQKEQSLLSQTNPSQEAYDWATGCGKADSATYYQYQGFGNQIWWGAQKLDNNTKAWYQGIEMSIDGNLVVPVNASTHSLYKYTPHLRGTTSFWMLYWRYFGDPVA